MAVTEVKKLGSRMVAKAAAMAPSAPPVKVLAEHVQDPHVLARKINELGASLRKELEPAKSSPLNGGNIIRNVALTAATTTTVYHRLNADPKGCICVRAQTAAYSAYEVANPAGVSRTDALSLKSNNTGTYDLWIF